MGLCSVLLGFALGSVQPMVMSLLHQITPEHRHGEALGLRLMAINASSVVMPMLFGTAGAVIGVAGVFWVGVPPWGVCTHRMAHECGGAGRMAGSWLSAGARRAWRGRWCARWPWAWPCCWIGTWASHRCACTLWCGWAATWAGPGRTLRRSPRRIRRPTHKTPFFLAGCLAGVVHRGRCRARWPGGCKASCSKRPGGWRLPAGSAAQAPAGVAHAAR